MRFAKKGNTAFTLFLVFLRINTIMWVDSLVGKTFKEVATIIKQIDRKDSIGVCLDTCHIHDAGYDLVNEYEILGGPQNEIYLRNKEEKINEEVKK